MKRIAYFDCFAGISGDMILGAMVDSGLSLETLKNELTKLNVPGWELSAEKVTRRGMTGTQVHVKTGEISHHRYLADIIKIISQSGLSDSVKDRALNIFMLLADAEAVVHGISREKVHFHEVGALDAIIDITGAAIAFDALHIDQVSVSPLNTGSGTIRAAHGVLPVPAPATSLLLEGFDIYSSGIQAELVTPTGAAIIRSFCKKSSSLPNITLESTGYGSGSKELEVANLLRLFIGFRNELHDETETVIQLETNIDDSSPEITAYLMERLFAAGALDVFITPIIMKKNRPGHLLAAIVSPEKEDTVTHIIFRESTSSGIRRFQRERYTLPRELQSVETPFGSIAVKIHRLGEEVVTISPEFEDCRRAAEETNTPLKSVYNAAITAWHHNREKGRKKS